MTVETPVKYKQHEALPPRADCGMCGRETDDPQMDHCHAHGWVRGITCRPCNRAMSVLDHGHVPPGISLEAALRQAQNCHECPGIAPDALKPGRPRWGGWPGPARPDWQFRPHPQVQEYVEAYAERLGISRSAAINAIVTEHIRETEEQA